MTRPYNRQKSRKVRLLADRFFDHVTFNDGCCEWNGSTNGRIVRYGILRRGIGESWKAHRISYELFVGPIPKGKMVLHKCDNGLCVNPSHLFIGDNSTNMKDMWDKKRRKWNLKSRAKMARRLARLSST